MSNEQALVRVVRIMREALEYVATDVKGPTKISPASYWKAVLECQKQVAEEALADADEALAALTPAAVSPSAQGSGVDELREVLLECKTFLMNAPLESGYCCCGDKVEAHNIGSGHSPVDAIQHAAQRQIENIDAALASHVVLLSAQGGALDDGEETYQLGKRDGYSEAVQQIDMRTGGDGEYRYCFLGMEGDEYHCPDPEAMIERIVSRLPDRSAQSERNRVGGLIYKWFGYSPSNLLDAIFSEPSVGRSEDA